MDRQTATRIIKDTFEQPFDKGRFINFSKNLFKYLDASGNFLWAGNRLPNAGAFQPYIDSIERIGKSDAQGKSEDQIDVLIVNLKKETSLERARTRQRNFVARYLEDKQRTAALVAFVPPNPSDWRFSLVRMDYNIVQSPSGKTKVETELTPARRYSFLVGENESSHTAQVQLLPILQNDERKPLLSDLEKAFNIEVVTREFFNKYRDLFYEVEEALQRIVQKDSKIREDFKTKGVDTVNFAKKLLGQIVFLYFLQKKGWFGVGRDEEWGTGPKDFLRCLFERKVAPYRNFFNDILEPLFYEALAVERTDDFYSRFNCKIPFLNGGLFDPINNYDWVHTDILIADDLFSNSQITKEGDIGTGILDVFDRYNFTVKEDEPLDKEVAVDPEMLGKVFENLLEVKDRKSKGTYYTPREIVHYMCQESLINYLDAMVNSREVSLVQEKPVNLKLFGAPATQQITMKTDGYTGRVPREDIEAFVCMGEMAIEHDRTAVRKQTEVEQGKIKSTGYNIKLKSIKENAREIDDALKNIRVCDPAIGSGAFPVGLMTEIVRARNTLTTYLPDNVGRTNYHFKRHAIQNCLYGVDIDPGAVEIAKLRLWLSLVVDEDDIKQIQPLPNLDYKIVCGNSLLGVERRIENWPLFADLEKLKPLHFDETNAKKKQEFRNQIDQLIKKLTNNKEVFDFEVYFSEVFHEKGGFDIVIANPPYVGEKGHKEIFREIKQGPLGSFYQGKMDIFYFFFHLAINLGIQGSQVAFITTDYYRTASGAEKLRQDFRRRTKVKRLVDFNELRIFESALGQHNMITILSKGYDENAIAETCVTTRSGLAASSTLQEIVAWQDNNTVYHTVRQKELYEGKQSYIRLEGLRAEETLVEYSSFQGVLEKINRQAELLGTICSINAGADVTISRITKKHTETFTGTFQCGDGVFVLDRTEVKKLCPSVSETQIIKTFIKNSHIDKYVVAATNQWLIYLRWEDNIDIYPNVKKHLFRFKTILEDQAERYEETYPWFALHRPRQQWFFEAPEKILAPYRSKSNTFGFSVNPLYASRDVFYITLNSEDYYIQYVLALLNSRLYYFWLYFKGKRKGEILEMYWEPLSQIPIRKVNLDTQKSFVAFVDKILAITKDADYFENEAKQVKVTEFERQIDSLVYQLYGLTAEEIALVEGFSKK